MIRFCIRTTSKIRAWLDRWRYPRIESPQDPERTDRHIFRENGRTYRLHVRRFLGGEERTVEDITGREATRSFDRF